MPVNSLTSPVIELEHVGFNFRESPVLEDISCTIRQGEYLAIIGPNGGGKTTLLKIILGLLTPSTGTVRLFGKNNPGVGTISRIGYVPQRISSAIFRFPTTVHELVQSGLTRNYGSWHRLSLVEQNAIKNAMETTGITNLKDQPVGELSGGQLQRVFIARALVAGPRILILDEPTVGVDIHSQEVFFAFLQKLNAELGLTIIFVTHELDVAVHEARTVLCLNRRLVCHISSKDLIKGPYLETLYGKQMKFISHQH